MFIILNTILKCVSMERSQNTHLSAWIISFINESHLHKVPKKMRRHCKHCWYSVSAYSNVCVHKHKQGRSRCITLSQFTVPPRLYILFKSFPRALSSHSSTSLPSHPACHPFFFLLFVPQSHRSLLQFQHFNISSNISTAESNVAE